MTMPQQYVTCKLGYPKKWTDIYLFFSKHYTPKARLPKKKKTAPANVMLIIYL